MRFIPSDAEWTKGRVASLPPRWEKRLLRAWTKLSPTDYRRANINLREATASLLTVRIPLDASDASLCDAAHDLAARCASLAAIFHTIDAVRNSMERICIGQGIEPPSPKVRPGPAVARMSCPNWWRRKLRRHQGQTVEAAAIRLGYVSKVRDLYVSNERLVARTQQNCRNVETLETTIATNENGQSFLLSELVKKSTANKSIRRAELMTRIAGFERIAVAESHVGLFITFTCPSRFHRFRTVNEGTVVVDNANYDPAENPGTAQKHLTKMWACIRAELKRKGIGVYGFRIAEPQHDGTPHWHLLLFTAPEFQVPLCQILKKHALKDSPGEPGALKHRCDIKLMDSKIGSAAGYIAKYVAKNIDGQHVGQDFNDRPAVETVVRVEAWAATWRIRQFQQIGGPPVGVWRELRRVRKLPVNAPEHLVRAHAAVNKSATFGGRENKSAAWDQYCHAQGGVLCGRQALIKLAMRSPEKLGIYGEESSPRPYGVKTTAEER